MSGDASYPRPPQHIEKIRQVMMLQELSEATLYFNNQGTPVKLPGVGTFTPSINRHGKFKIGFRADTVLRNGIDAPGAYSGQVRHKDRVGLNNAGYKELWDADHPDDLLEV